MRTEALQAFSSTDEKRLKTSTMVTSPVFQSEDVNFFISSLEHSGQAAIAVASTVTPNALTDMSNQLLKSSNYMGRALKAMGNGTRKNFSLGYATQLSTTVLGTQMLVKCLSKGTQLVEKISNLQ